MKSERAVKSSVIMVPWAPLTRGVLFYLDLESLMPAPGCKNMDE